MKWLRASVFSPASNQRGDTIVEVLIAVAVISLILTAAYATTNRNVQATQDAQEQNYAVKLVETQLELLNEKPLTAASTCFDIAGQPANNGAPTFACTFKNGGATYVITIQQTSGTYNVAAKWEGLGGRNKQVSMYYRTVK